MAQHQLGAALAHIFELFAHRLQHRLGQVFIEVVHEVQAQVGEGAVPAAGRCEVGYGMRLGRGVLAEMQLVRMIGTALGVAEIAGLVFIADVIGKGRLGRLVGIHHLYLLLYPGRIQPDGSAGGLGLFLLLAGGLFIGFLFGLFVQRQLLAGKRAGQERRQDE